MLTDIVDSNAVQVCMDMGMGRERARVGPIFRGFGPSFDLVLVLSMTIVANDRQGERRNTANRCSQPPNTPLSLTAPRSPVSTLPRPFQSSRDAARNPTDAPDAQHVTAGREDQGEMDEGERELQNMRETSGLMYDDMVSR